MSVNLSFIDLNERDQAKELRCHLKSKGADICEDGPEDFVADLKQLIKNCTILWKSTEASEAEIEAVMNSLISLVILVPDCDEMVSLFCQAVAATDKKSQWDEVRLRVLLSLFNGFGDKSVHRLPVYSAMVKFAGHINLMSWIPADIKQVREFSELWGLSKVKSQELLRGLHDAYVESGQRENASKVMIELLSSYTENTASQAVDDAVQCIVSSIADPQTFLLDHLLTLKPVKLLEGLQIYELLMVFVTGRLSDYLSFSEKNKDYIEKLGLDDAQNVQKMKLLTFLHLAEGRSSIDFQTIQKEIEIPAEEVEQFIIDAVKTKTVTAKLDQMNRKVLISSSTHRTFEKQNWLELGNQLELWRSNLEKTSDSFRLIMQQAAQQ
ncbi:eukaryotic translation initiation factor 3 subunit M-like [Watersipora subatra]|uniref:eukaryotic translation initiation factor 3 subunit M-like n=1 Tax=Watersipora subatra TaxID=2589382 RepID=UPI00355B89B1